MFNYLKPKPTDEILAHPFIVAAGQLLPVASLCHQGELKQMIEGAKNHLFAPLNSVTEATVD